MHTNTHTFAWQYHPGTLKVTQGDLSHMVYSKPMENNQAHNLEGTSLINYSLCDVLVKEILGSERLANAYGWVYFITGIVMIFAGFIPGRRIKFLCNKLFFI